jgi:hypothetical protein
VTIEELPPAGENELAAENAALPVAIVPVPVIVKVSGVVPPAIDQPVESEVNVKGDT